MHGFLFFNFRLDSSGNIKVGDFGLAEDIYNCGYFRQEEKENVRLHYKWMAIESLTDSIFSEKTDVVRCNIVIIIMNEGNFFQGVLLYHGNKTCMHV